jgi:hypothetical protein
MMSTPAPCNLAAGNRAAMKRTALGVAFLALLLISVQPATPQPISAQPSPPQSADASPSAHKLALARQLVEVTRMDAIMTGAFRNMVSGVTASASQSLSADRQARMKIIGEAEGAALEKLVPQIVDSMVNGYARNFSEQELSDILAFYQSPSGRSMVAKTPQFMQGMMVEMAALMPQIRRDMGEDVCAKITCTAAERAAFFGAEPAKNPPQGTPSTTPSRPPTP